MKRVSVKINNKNDKTKSLTTLFPLITISNERSKGEFAAFQMNDSLRKNR